MLPVVLSTHVEARIIAKINMVIVKELAPPVK
jgi:hypothetical protein